ncbi:unnamed protein product [Paramecium sonneborni]|uniref:Uncharacterized protein n=1 Tax=Paramecium sonneborni TaxID=65129 RepID=A0A8S1MIK4_9CILI|nr:unnamed protein product [Paramecium sonneborni]
MFTLFLKKLRSLTMKSQIILFNLLTLILVLSVGWINYYVQTEIFSAISSNSLSQILQIQDQDQIGFLAQNLGLVIETKFMAVLQQMEQINHFYSFFQREKENLINYQQMDPCISINDFLKNNISFYVPKFCYQAIGVPDYISIPNSEKEVYILQDFLSLLNHYSLVLDRSLAGMIQVASVSKTKYFSQFPFCFLLPWFDITQLPWYQNHLLESGQNKGFIFSPLNDFFITKIKEMSITSSIYHNGQIIGIIREGLIINDYLIPIVPYNVLLLDHEGLVVYFNIEQLRNKTDYFYIYEENVTGFNKTDWKEMIQFSKKDDKIILVLENKLSQEKVNVYSLEVLKNNFTLVVYTNITTKLDSQNKSAAIQEKSFFNFTISLFAQIILGLAAIIIQIFVLIIVFRPLRQFSKIIKQYTLSQGNNINSQIFKMINKNSQRSDAVSTLQNKIINFSQTLFKSKERKCDMCKIWESFSYNLKESDFDLDQIKNQFLNLKNGQQEFNPKMLKIIKLGIN